MGELKMVALTGSWLAAFRDTVSSLITSQQTVDALGLDESRDTEISAVEHVLLRPSDVLG